MRSTQNGVVGIAIHGYFYFCRYFYVGIAASKLNVFFGSVKAAECDHMGVEGLMKWIFAGLILLSVLFGALNGRMDAVSAAALQECGEAIELTLSLAGSMCLWSGLMKIADRAELTSKISRLFSPVIRLLFRGLDHTGAAARAITLNISANLLGLGNAATPLGIAAMKELDKLNPEKGCATDHMVLFVVLNTASMQILPTTTALMRQNTGSPAPLDILPAVWIASLVSVLSGIVAAWLLRGTGCQAADRQSKRARPRAVRSL